MGVSSLPKTVTRQRRECDLSPGPCVPESSTLTTRLPSHPGPLDNQWILQQTSKCAAVSRHEASTPPGAGHPPQSVERYADSGQTAFDHGTVLRLATILDVTSSFLLISVASSRRRAEWVLQTTRSRSTPVNIQFHFTPRPVTIIMWTTHSVAISTFYGF